MFFLCLFLFGVLSCKSYCFFVESPAVLDSAWSLPWSQVVISCSDVKERKHFVSAQFGVDLSVCRHSKTTTFHVLRPSLHYRHCKGLSCRTGIFLSHFLYHLIEAGRLLFFYPLLRKTDHALIFIILVKSLCSILGLFT